MGETTDSSSEIFKGSINLGENIRIQLKQRVYCVSFIEVEGIKEFIDNKIGVQGDTVKG